MQTLYIDVFLLINFSVDLLAAFFSVRVLHIATSTLRLVLSALVGAVYAGVSVLFLTATGSLLLGTPVLLFMTLLVTGGAHWIRKFRWSAVFLLMELLLAGCVYYGYQILHVWTDSLILDGTGGAENRSLLIFAVLVLLSIGILRLFRTLLSETRAEGVCRIAVELNGITAETDALVDSGNLVRDPISGLSVILAKAQVFHQLHIPPWRDDSPWDTDPRLHVRVRLIPCTIGGVRTVLYALRPDRISIVYPKGREPIRAFIALDKEEGSYGGYQALIPSAVLEHVYK